MRFPDVNKEKWYAPYVERASDAAVMIGDDRGCFRPEDALTRAAAAAIVCRLLEKMEAAS